MIVEWDADCNNDGLVDKGQIISGQLPDADNNGIPDGPVISQQPVGGTYVGGQPVTLTVVASAGTGATYRWRKDGVNLFNGITYAGVTTPSLTITADEPSQSGDYSVAITNACGTTVSDIVWVEVTCPADFNNDGGTDGQDLFGFFEAWSGGESNADLNFDGGIDGGDVTAFYVRWENGC